MPLPRTGGPHSARRVPRRLKQYGEKRGKSQVGRWDSVQHGTLCRRGKKASWICKANPLKGSRTSSAAKAGFDRRRLRLHLGKLRLPRFRSARPASAPRPPPCRLPGGGGSSSLLSMPVGLALLGNGHGPPAGPPGRSVSRLATLAPPAVRAVCC